MTVGEEEVPGKKAEVKGGQATPPQAMASWPHALSCIQNQELSVAGVGQGMRRWQRPPQVAFPCLAGGDGGVCSRMFLFLQEKGMHRAHPASSRRSSVS